MQLYSVLCQIFFCICNGEEFSQGTDLRACGA